MTATAGAIEILIQRITSERSRAARQMATLAGDSSACAMGRDGQSFPAYKYFEGQAAGFGVILRTLGRTDEGELASVVRAVVEASSADVERRRGSGRDWEAYTHGVLDAALASQTLLP